MSIPCSQLLNCPGFALKVSGYADRYISAVDNVQLTAAMIYGRCYVLLQLGRSQATSVVPALALLAGVSCTLSLFTGWSQQPTSSQLQQHLGQTFDRTLDLLNGMTSYFQDLSVGHGTATGPSRLRCSLGKSLEAFNLQADQLLDEIWTYHIPADVQKSLVRFKEVQLILQPQDEVVTDARRINASIAKAESYRSLEDPFNAELVYISLWHGVTEACHRQRILNNHEKLLKVGVAFSTFLCEYGRMSDAQTVLLGLWSQQQALGYKSETTTALLEELATAMKQSGLQDMALEVFGTILADSELEDSSKREGIRTVISDMTLDMVRDARSSSFSEAALRRVLEERISQGLKVSDASVVNALITELVNYDRFGDVVSVAAETLHRLWPAVMDDPYKLVPFDPNVFDSELASLATSLAQAYMKTDQMAGVGPIYWHLFQAARHSVAVDDSAAVEYANLALEAFKQTGQVHEIIALREDLLDYCIGKYGEDHTITIESRYALASIYSQEQLLEKAKQQYGSLWSMFVTKGPECGFDPRTSKALYAGYTTLLKKHAPVDRGALHEITEGYRSACLNHYGEQDSTTLEAVLKLAESWNALHPGGSEAIQLYEWLVDRQEGVLLDDTKAIIKVAESYLTDFYQMCISDGNTQRQVTAKVAHLQGKALTRAVLLQEKRYQREKTRRGASHPTTLSNLAIWVSMLRKQDSQDARATVIREVQTAIDSVMQSENQASSLYNAAVILATSCSTNGFVEEGLNTVQRLTEQLIFEQGDTDQHVRRSNLVFLMAFEAHLTGSMVDFAEVHAKVLTESALWECYKRVSQTRTDPGLTLACGARLRSFLVDHNSLDRAALIEHDLYERFLDAYGAAFAQSIQTAREFFSMLLQELNSERLPIRRSLCQPQQFNFGEWPLAGAGACYTDS